MYEQQWVAHLVLLVERLVLLVLDDELRLELLGRLDEGAVPLLRALLQRESVSSVRMLALVQAPLKGNNGCDVWRKSNNNGRNTITMHAEAKGG